MKMDVVLFQIIIREINNIFVGFADLLTDYCLVAGYVITFYIRILDI